MTIPDNEHPESGRLYISGISFWLSSHVAMLEELGLLSYSIIGKYRADLDGFISHDCYVTQSVVIERVANGISGK